MPTSEAAAAAIGEAAAATGEDEVDQVAVPVLPEVVAPSNTKKGGRKSKAAPATKVAKAAKGGKKGAKAAAPKNK